MRAAPVAGRSFRHRTVTIVTGFLLACSVPAISQELIGRWDEWEGQYGDVWAVGDRAYLARFGHHCIDIINIADPSMPHSLLQVCADPPNEFSSAQDVKVADGRIFIALEANAFDGVLITDAISPNNPDNRLYVRIPGFHSVHNLFYDDGMLYLANSRTPEVAIVDLAAGGTDLFSRRITEPKWMLTGVGTSFVHDVTVWNGRLYAAAWNAGLWVYDVTDIQNQPPRFLGATPGEATHSCWPTEDGRYVVTGEERSGGGIQVYRIDETNQSLTFTQTDSLVLPGFRARSVHNQVVVGYRLYNSWYEAGLQVFDIDPVSGRLRFVSSFETLDISAGNGAWGVFPFFGLDKVLLSDIENGLLIVDAIPRAFLTVSSALPGSVHPLRQLPVRIRITGNTALVDTESVMLHTRIENGPAADSPMQQQLDGSFQAFLPKVPCGSDLEFHFTAELHDESVIENPGGGAAYRRPSLSGMAVQTRHDFELASHALEWTIGAPDDDATGGIWKWNNPPGIGPEPDEDNPFGEGFLCYFTGSGDVDNGKTTLTSPILDASVPDAGIGFALWYSNDVGENPGEDALEVFLSNDAGAGWVLMDRIAQSTNMWVERIYRIDEFLEPTSAMQVRFVASDYGGPSLVEAAVDDVIIVRLGCATTGDANQDGFVDLVDARTLPECLAGPFGIPGGGCGAFDSGPNGRIDLKDVAAFQNAFTGPP